MLTNGCCSTLHHYDSTRVICELRGLFGGRAGRECSGEGCDHSVARAGNVSNFVGTDDRDVDGT